MDIYVTSKNSGPSWSSDPITMMYIGTSYEKAVEAVGIFIKYEKTVIVENQKLYSALPSKTDREMIHYYMADGWWFSIEKLIFEDVV
jgi:hypothetical protein